MINVIQFHYVILQLSRVQQSSLPRMELSFYKNMQYSIVFISALSGLAFLHHILRNIIQTFVQVFFPLIKYLIQHSFKAQVNAFFITLTAFNTVGLIHIGYLFPSSLSTSFISCLQNSQHLHHIRLLSHLKFTSLVSYLL